MRHHVLWICLVAVAMAQQLHPQQWPRRIGKQLRRQRGYTYKQSFGKKLRPVQTIESQSESNHGRQLQKTFRQVQSANGVIPTLSSLTHSARSRQVGIPLPSAPNNRGRQLQQTLRQVQSAIGVAPTLSSLSQGVGNSQGGIPLPSAHNIHDHQLQQTLRQVQSSIGVSPTLSSLTQSHLGQSLLNRPAAIGQSALGHSSLTQSSIGQSSVPINQLLLGSRVEQTLGSSNQFSQDFIAITTDIRDGPHADGSYYFRYTAENGLVREEGGIPTGPCSIRVTGSYAYFTPANEVFTMEYVSDENGYQVFPAGSRPDIYTPPIRQPIAPPMPAGGMPPCDDGSYKPDLYGDDGRYKPGLYGDDGSYKPELYGNDGSYIAELYGADGSYLPELYGDSSINAFKGISSTTKGSGSVSSLGVSQVVTGSSTGNQFGGIPLPITQPASNIGSNTGSSATSDLTSSLSNSQAGGVPLPFNTEELTRPGSSINSGFGSIQEGGVPLPLTPIVRPPVISSFKIPVGNRLPLSNTAQDSTEASAGFKTPPSFGGFGQRLPSDIQNINIQDNTDQTSGNVVNINTQDNRGQTGVSDGRITNINSQING